MEAHRQGDLARCTGLIDQFCESARGVELGHALCLKANYFIVYDSRHCPEGLSLVDEALDLGADCPALQMKCARDGVGLCFHTGDLYRAARYEGLGHQLLRDHPDNPSVQSNKLRFYYNLAHLASLRQDHPYAYWLLVQGSSALFAQNGHESRELRMLAFPFYLRLAEVCLAIGRSPEADEALEKALDWISSKEEAGLWAAYRASYLLACNQPVAARATIDTVSQEDTSNWLPINLVLFLLARSSVAQAQGDIRAFHRDIARAQKLAADHALDHLLCRIQRVMGTPANMEATK